MPERSEPLATAVEPQCPTVEAAPAALLRREGGADRAPAMVGSGRPRIALVTANLGGIDRPLPIPAHKALRFVDAMYFTDARPARVIGGWTTVVPVEACADPRMEAKRYKCQAHRLEATRGYEFIAWADACFEFRSLGFLVEWAERLRAEPEERRALFLAHPIRATVAEEYEYVLAQLARGNAYLRARYTAAQFEAERRHFEDAGHQLDTVRLLCGGLWLAENNVRFAAFQDAWWNVVTTLNPFDQTALAPLLDQHGIEPHALLVGQHYETEDFIRRQHA